VSENRRVDEVLSRRALNGATLARQLLLERVALTPLATVEHPRIAPCWSACGASGYGSVLADGLVSAIWRVEPGGLVVSHVPRPKRVLASIAAEGRRLARFLEVTLPDVRLVALSP
jgi:hypothetical protein